jgi:hypothetical protein
MNTIENEKLIDIVVDDNKIKSIISNTIKTHLPSGINIKNLKYSHLNNKLNFDISFADDFVDEFLRCVIYDYLKGIKITNVAINQKQIKDFNILMFNLFSDIGVNIFQRDSNNKDFLKFIKIIDISNIIKITSKNTNFSCSVTSDFFVSNKELINEINNKDLKKYHEVTRNLKIINNIIKDSFVKLNNNLETIEDLKTNATKYKLLLKSENKVEIKEFQYKTKEPEQPTTIIDSPYSSLTNNNSTTFQVLRSRFDEITSSNPVRYNEIYPVDVNQDELVNQEQINNSTTFPEINPSSLEEAVHRYNVPESHNSLIIKAFLLSLNISQERIRAIIEGRILTRDIRVNASVYNNFVLILFHVINTYIRTISEKLEVVIHINTALSRLGYSININEMRGNMSTGEGRSIIIERYHSLNNYISTIFQQNSNETSQDSNR